MNVRRTAEQWLAAGQEAVVVEVIATRGSAPREAGTRMLVARDTAVGTIGGGRLEYEAMTLARQWLAGGAVAANAPPHQTVALGPSLGQCCGGSVTLGYRGLDASAVADWPAAAPRFFLQLYGAGHIGRAVVALLATIDCRVQWIDERAEAFAGVGALPPHIDIICVDTIEAEVRGAPPRACYLVLTHEHDLDLRITETVLRRNDFVYCGLIGSKTKRARFVHRLGERGIDAATLDRLVCPIGLPGITGKEPAVVAVAIVAQLLQLPTNEIVL